MKFGSRAVEHRGDSRSRDFGIVIAGHHHTAAYLQIIRPRPYSRLMPMPPRKSDPSIIDCNNPPRAIHQRHIAERWAKKRIATHFAVAQGFLSDFLAAYIHRRINVAEKTAIVGKLGDTG